MMKKSTLLLMAACLMVLSTFAQQPPQRSKVVFKLQVHDTTIYVGDTLLINATAKTQDTVFTHPDFSLTIRPEYLGTFTGKTFSAVKPGWGYILANYNGLMDQCRINVLDTIVSKDTIAPDHDNPDCLAAIMRILPKDTIVTTGSVIQYKAQILKDSVWTDTPVTWSLKGHDLIGTISSDGKLTVTRTGISFVVAKGNSGKIMSRVIAIKALPADTTGLNTIHILRVLPNGKILPGQTIKEGGKFTLGGLPTPLNFLNGAKIYFPVGSLHEDITLQVKMPTFAKVDSTGTNISFGRKRKILSGITFEVYVNNQHVTPYYFDTPLNVTVPFKRGLIKNMDIDINKLSVFFAKDSLTLDTLGLTNIVLDTASNQIYANVAHFSNLAIAESNEVLSVKEISAPSSVLFYPNPVDQSMTINLENTEAASIVISNLLGQTVLTKPVTASQMMIDLSRLGTGMYQLQVLDSNKQLLSIGKLLKK